ncbi:MAG: hypothetical protein SGI92_25160 [Bryobacteraceae bacterium]|nr:hypothetical protein [Bryobacteraceae bacterium]
MTVDERLDRLTERHEALTQTVEIIAGMQRENEKMIGQLGQFIDSLARIAQAHERRIDHLEEGNEQ